MFLTIDFQRSQRYKIVSYNVEGFDKFEYYLMGTLYLFLSGLLVFLSVKFLHAFPITLTIIFLVSFLNSRKLWVVRGLNNEQNFDLVYDVLNRDLDSKQIATTSEKNIIGRFKTTKLFNVNHLGYDKLRRQVIVIFDGDKIMVNSALLMNNIPSAFGFISQVYLIWLLITLKLEIRRRAS